MNINAYTLMKYFIKDKKLNTILSLTDNDEIEDINILSYKLLLKTLKVFTLENKNNIYHIKSQSDIELINSICLKLYISDVVLLNKCIKKKIPILCNQSLYDTLINPPKFIKPYKFNCLDNSNVYGKYIEAINFLISKRKEVREKVIELLCDPGAIPYLINSDEFKYSTQLIFG